MMGKLSRSRKKEEVPKKAEQESSDAPESRAQYV